MANAVPDDTIDQLSNQIQGLYQERVVALDATYAAMTDWLRQVEHEVPEKYKRYRHQGRHHPRIRRALMYACIQERHAT
jgi:hypothetical protein